MKKRCLAVLLILVLSIFSLAGCGGGSEKTDSLEATVKIGTIFPRSGNLALLGEQAFYGAEIARQIINENGGINGMKVEFASADAPGSTEASTEANRLIDQQGVNVIIGSLSSGNALAISSVTERNSAILWETSGISDALTDGDGKYIFRTCDRGGLRGYYGMQFIAETLSEELGIAKADLKVALINEDSSYGESLVNGALEGAEDFGLNVVAHERYSKDITDFSSMILRIKEFQPDIIFAISYVNDAVLLYDTIRQFNVVPKALVGGGAGFTDPNFNAVFGEDSNGVFCIDMPTNLPETVFEDQATKDLQKEFKTRYLEMDKNSETPPLAAECVFMGTYVLLHDVLPNADSMSSDDIAAAAMATKLKETTMGWAVEFGNDGQNMGSTPVIGQWQGGKTKTVWPKKFANTTVQYLPMSK